MRKVLLTSLLFAGGMVTSAFAQTKVTVLQDLTSQLTNADFSADAAVTTTIRTYDYDMTDSGAGSGVDGAVELFGQQAVTGWTAEKLTDNTKVSASSSDARTDGLNARAAGIFAYEDDSEEEYQTIGLGGSYYAPDISAEQGITGQALGIVAVWGADIKYSQDVTLPAGGYMILVKHYNGAGSAEMNPNYNGFVAADGTSYLSSKTTYTPSVWETDTIFVRLKAETSGVIQLGYKSGNYGSGSAPHLFIDNVKLYSIDPAPLDKAEIDAKKVELLEVIEKGQDLGADTKAAQAVYDNPNATLEDVIKAIEDQKALNEAKQVDLSEFFITNPHFTLDTPLPEDEGICTYDYDMVDPNGSNGRKVSYYGMLPVTGWESSNPETNARACGVFAIGSNSFLGGNAFLPPTEMSDGSKEGNVLGFVSVWSALSQYTQQVTIPAGKYTLEISYYNAGGTTAVKKNLMGFITDDNVEYLGESLTFPVGKWVKDVITFNLEEATSGKFSLGYEAANAGSGGMPHFFIDGIALRYVGEINFDPSLFALQAAVNVAQNVVDEPFNADLKKALQDAIDAGDALLKSQSEDAEKNNEATKAITDLMADVNASIKAYKNLQEFQDGALAEALEKYEGYIPALFSELETLNDAVTDALNDYNLTTAEVEELIASLAVKEKAGIKTAWNEALASGQPLARDLDITILFDELGYTYSTSEKKGSDVPDKQWSYGDASNFKTQYGTAEVWNQSPFTVSQTLTDMPKGKYTVTTRAFYRTAGNDDNYNNYSPESKPLAFVFAGQGKTGITNVAELATTNAETYAGKALITDTEVYVPNNQQTAYAIFTNSDYDELVAVSASTAVVTDGGELTFGVTSDQMSDNSWVVWYSFELSYNAFENSDLDTEISGLIEEATELTTTSTVVLKSLDNLEGAITSGENALDKDNQQVKIDAIIALKAAIAYASESETLVAKLDAVVKEFQDLYIDNEIVSSDATFTNLLGAIDDASQSGYESNEQVKEFTDQLPIAWTNYVLGQDAIATATEESPVDLTLAILNADFSYENSSYWTFAAKDTETTIGQNNGYNGSEYQNTETGVVVSKFIESWRPNGEVLKDGDIKQEIRVALPAGYYRLEADAFATNQKEIPEEGIQGAYLMAKAGNDVYKTNVGIDVTSGVPQHFTVDFYSNGTSLTSVGLRLESTNASWIVVDNFKLSAIGQTAPDAIEDVNTDASLTNNGVVRIYNLAGQRLNRLQPGINIINGKKVIIK